jgi:hypothetical protein
MAEKVCEGAFGRGCGRVLSSDNFVKLKSGELKDICIDCQALITASLRGKRRKRRSRFEIFMDDKPKPNLIKNAADWQQQKKSEKWKRYAEPRKQEWAALRKFTKEQYSALIAAQRGLCACCHQPPADGKKLVIDHQHGVLPLKVRGLLCGHCNTALGFAKDNIKTLTNMVDYLERNK